MKNLKKIALLIIVSLISVIVFPNFSNAKTTTVSNEEELRNAITNAEEGEIIKLTDNILLTKPIEITEKTFTIDGSGFSISRNTENWSVSGSNASLITSGIAAKVTLSNITLKGSQKYGAQAYNGGYLVLNGVTASDNGFGGILVNAGTVEVISLSLGHNGVEGSNNGIEIAKGKEISDAEESNQPKLIMNGVLTSTETTNVIYLATNDNLTEFEVENTENTKNKVLLSGNKVVVTNENNEVLFISNENNKIQLEGETFAKNINITINLMDKTTTVTVQEGTVLAKETLISKINLNTLGISNYTITGFFTDPEFNTEFNFTNPITTDTILYAKLSQNNSKEKDDTPKTGIESNIDIALFIFALSTITLIVLKRKDI